MPADNAAAGKFNMDEIDDFIRRCSLNFRSQIEQLSFETREQQTSPDSLAT